MNNLKSTLKRMIPTSIAHGARRLLLRRHLASFPHRVVEHTYIGFPLKISIQDATADQWYDKLYVNDSIPEVEYLRKGRLKPGATLFDLGAHQGVVAMVLARMVGDSGLVVAVEGTKHNVDVALENCRLNGITNLIVKHAVAAEKPGIKMSFSDSLNGAVGDDFMSTEVTSISVDSLAAEHGCPQVVFIDVEGYECQVLDGAQKTLSQDVDFFVEVHAGLGLERHGSVEKVLSYFPLSKYELFWSDQEDIKFHALTELVAPSQKRFFLIAFAR